MPPLKTMSAGSSGVAKVATTAPRRRDTTEIESETSFTTQTSFSSRTARETGSKPTGISSMRIGTPPFVSCKSKTERLAPGVFRTKRSPPSRESAIG